MIGETQLIIRLTPGVLRPQWNRGGINQFRGGPETLLRWLEDQLGLPVPPTHRADRIAEFAAVLDLVTDGVFTASMTADRWGTASELLSMRDELRLGGWDDLR